MKTLDLEQLASWAQPLIDGLSPAQQLRLSRKIGVSLRRMAAQRITAQRNPDGSAFEPRKNNITSRLKRKGVRNKMFARLKTARFMQVKVDSDGVSVGFWGRVGRIATVHQEGLTDRVQKGGPMYTYPQRQLLGFSHHEEGLIRQLVLDFLWQSNEQ